MSGRLKLVLGLGLLVLALHGLSPQEPLLGDLLIPAWQADQQNRVGVASSLYARAIALQPENPLLHIKRAEMLILLNRPYEVARHIVQAIEILSKDPKSPVDLKRYACDLLMGRLPVELRTRRMQLGYDYEGWLFPSPFSTLPTETQKRVAQIVPKEWLFPTKVSEGWFLLSIGEREKGLAVLKEAAIEGDVQTIYVLMSNFVSKEQRAQIAQSWLQDAERTENPFLWLVALHLLWRTGQIDAFRASFRKALERLKDQPALLLELADLCRQMGWEAERKQVLALLPPSLRPAPTIADIRREFTRALDEGDFAKTKALVRALTDFPNYFRSIVLSADSIRKMLGRGWHDFVVELIQLDLVPELPYDTKEVLLQDAAFNPSRFSHWMRLFLSKPEGDIRRSGVNLLQSAASVIDKREPERAIWLLEQGLLIFPDEPNLLRSLAFAYEQAGYPHRTIEILKDLLRRSIEAGIVDSNTLGRIWDIALRYKQLPEIEAWLKEQRPNFPLGYFPAIARLYLQIAKPKEALNWLEEALAIAKERGWLGDAEIHAQVHYMLRSPDPRAVEEAMKLREKVARTSGLFHPETYEMRLTCLLWLGRTEDAKRVLDEARRLYPDHPFTDRVQGLAQIAITDWNEELKREIERWQNLAAPNYAALVRLAYATVKAGKTNEAKELADKLMAGMPNWRDGYIRAVEFFARRIDAVVPFARWFSEIASNSSSRWRHAVEEAGRAIRVLGETSLYGAFMLSSVLLFPDSEGDQLQRMARLHELTQLVEVASKDWWFLMTDEDKERLKSVLTKERINIHALNQLKLLSHRADLFGFGGGESFRKWLETIQGSQGKSSRSLICQLRERLAQIDREQLRQLISQLEQADWSDANLCPLTFFQLPKRIADEGFRDEAIALLQIAIKHAPQEQKANLMAQLIELTGKLPEQPKGDEAKDGKAWLVHAQAAWKTGRLDEAKQAALKALEFWLPLSEQVDALEIIASSDPELAFKLISEQLPRFLVTEPYIDPPIHLLKLASMLFKIASTRRDLAPKIVPILERVSNFSEGMKINTYSQLALLHFWAGNKLQGITILFEQLDKGKPEWNLHKVMGVMIRADVSEDVRSEIAQRLGSYFQSRRVSLSTLARELGNVREPTLMGSFDPRTSRSLLEISPDGLVALARLLKRQLDATEIIIPREFLEETLRRVHHFALVKKPFSQERLLPDEVVNAWWELFEAAFQKALKTPGAAKSLKQWLRQFWVERPDTEFSKTVWFEKLKSLAE
jgi:tetratricopeptide (TPR) repeat protein